MRRRVGVVEQRVIDVFGLSFAAGTPIFLGQSNEEHMRSEHPDDYAKYFGKLDEILAFPDFLAKHPKNDSIEYIKVFEPDHVLVAVRVSNSGALYARTLFVMNAEKVKMYQSQGYMKPLI